MCLDLLIKKSNLRSQETSHSNPCRTSGGQSTENVDLWQILWRGDKVIVKKKASYFLHEPSVPPTSLSRQSSAPGGFSNVAHRTSRYWSC